MGTNDAGAHFDATAEAIQIDGITLRDKDITREAQRWTTGERGPAVDDVAVLAGADLTTFVTEAVKVGALALSATGQSQESRALDRLIREAGERAADSTTKATETTERAARAASDVMAKAAGDARKAIIEADAATRKQIVTALADARTAMTAEVRRLLGGDQPELLDRMQPVLDKFGADLDAKATAATNDVVAKAVKQFDMSDPSSPMARHAREIDARQQQLAEQFTQQHTEVTTTLAEVVTALKVQDATAKIRRITPAKGDSYAAGLHAVLTDIAAGLGDEYVDTSAIPGTIARCKKGDGVLRIADGAGNLVIEMTDSARRSWGTYLDEAERNRDAATSLGLVRTVEQNDGHTIRLFGTRRIVAAFDPERDDPDLLRTLVMLLRAGALAATARTGGDQLATAEEKIVAAGAELEKLGEVKKAADAIHKSATKIENSCTGIYSGVNRLLAEALAAITDTGALEATDERGVA